MLLRKRRNVTEVEEDILLRKRRICNWGRGGVVLRKRRIFYWGRGGYLIEVEEGCYWGRGWHVTEVEEDMFLRRAWSWWRSCKRGEEGGGGSKGGVQSYWSTSQWNQGGGVRGWWVSLLGCLFCWDSQPRGTLPVWRTRGRRRALQLKGLETWRRENRNMNGI